MRLLVAMMKHETNSFSPVPTDLDRFEDWALYRHEAAQRALKGTNTPFAAFLDLAAEAGAQIVTPIAAEAMPSGPVQADAYEALVSAILEPLAKQRFDGALLDLHGAMVAEGEADGEGGLLERLRALAPELPIAVACDLHCNLTSRMVENCTALIGYKTYPHVDMYDTGARIGRVLLGALTGETSPVMAWGNIPLLAQTLCMGTDDEPMGALQEMAREEEARGVLAATLFGGFPLADMADAGVSAVVVANRDMSRAEAARDRLLAAAWERRRDFIYGGTALPEALARAKEIEEGPVILLDHADNVGSGGTQDAMAVIAAVLEQGLDDVAVAAVRDPAAVAAMTAAGVGAELTLALGGKTAMPAIGREGEPLRVTGRVKALTDGRWRVRGPMYTGVEVNTGPSALLQVGGVEIVVTSKHHEPWDLGIFTHNGVDPRARRYLVIKSRIHYRAGFAPLAKATIRCDGVGVTTSDNSLLAFEKLRRPIFPLDWNAAP